MKKISLIFLAVAAIGLASCDEVSNGVMQTNPQLPVLPADDMSVTSTVPETLDLTALNTAGTPIALGTVAMTSTLPEGYVLHFVGQISRDDSFAKTADFALNYDPETHIVMTTADDFEGAYIDVMGKSAKTKDVFFRAVAYAQNSANENEYVRLGGQNTYFCSQKIAVTPFDLNIVIEDSYYLYGTVNGWKQDTAIEFNHSGRDPYDDPIFSHIFTVDVPNAQSGWWWKVMAGSTFASGEDLKADNAYFGPAKNGDEALEGLLMPMTVDADGNVTAEPGAGCLKEPGVFNLVLDMESQTYEFKYAAYPMFVMGSAFGNNIKKAPWLMSPNQDTYGGFFNFDGEYTIVSDISDTPVVYGQGATEAEIVANGKPFTAEAGFYFVRADLKDGKYACVPVETIGLIGTFNDWGAQVNLRNYAEGKGNGTWRGRVTLDGGAFKIRINDNWDFNLGGSPDGLVINGADISGFEAGEYDVTLNISQAPYTIALKKRS